MRLSRTPFEHVLSLLRAHAGEIFVSGKGTPPLSLEIQLAIALYRFGHYGNASRVEAVAYQFGASAGLVMKCTKRVIRKINRLAPTNIRWPSAQRRAQRAEWARSSYGFDNCIGATDGTTFPLAYQPALHPWTYYDRKGRYSLNAVLTCDWDGLFISVVQGRTGAAPDAFVQTLADWHRYPQVYFSDGQYLLGDKGIKYTSWVIGPILKPESTTSERRNFNFRLARLRVRSEHANGVLKGRFAGSKELRVKLNGKNDFDCATS